MKKLTLIVIVSVLSFTIHAQEIKKIKITELTEMISKSETPLVVNFWATFCIPCIHEIPYFLELAKKYESTGIKLLLVSLDMENQYPDGLKKFAKKRKFTAPLYWLNEDNGDYFIPLVDQSWSGAIPASLFVNNKTGYRSFFEEEFTKEKLEQEILKLTAQ